MSIYIAIIIVNYRTSQLTVDCLRSISGESWLPQHGRVIVVDNASGDDSVAVIEQTVNSEGWQSWVEVIVMEQNGGFAYGNNAGIRRALDVGVGRCSDTATQSTDGNNADRPEYVLLLNPDTVVRPGAIQALVQFMDEHPQVGFAGSRLENPNGSSQQAAHRFSSVWSEFESAIRLGPISRMLAPWVVTPPERDEPHACDWLPGASLMMRRQMLDQVGMLDEGYFMYYEEVDLCLRAKRVGWEVWYVPHSRIMHLVGQASGVTTQSGSVQPRLKRRPAYWFESRKRYFTKNHGVAYRIFADLAWLSGYCFYLLRGVIQRRPNTDPPYLLRDFLRYSLGLGGKKP